MSKMIVITILGMLILSGLGNIVIGYKSTEQQIVIPKNHTKKVDLNNENFFDFLMKVIMKISHYPSLVACIIKKDAVVWSNSYGLYDIEHQKYATEDTIYRICSITKTVTGTALMQLYEKGYFELDDDINDYLIFNCRNPNFPDKSITFRMLLSHSSSVNGSPDSFYWFNFSGDPPFSFYPYPWIQEYIDPEGGYYDPLIWSDQYGPGEGARYSNANFVLIAHLVELLSGESFIEYCREHIFQPLQMYNTSFNLSEFDIDNVAIPYHYDFLRYYKINETPSYLPIYNYESAYYRTLHYPAGGIYSTLSDISHLLIAHMNGGVYDGVRILEEATVDEMHKNQPPNLGFGLAWYYTNGRYRGIASGHEGDAAGLHSAMLVEYPENDIGILYFVNGDRYSSEGTIGSNLIRNLLFHKSDNLSKEMQL